MINEADYRTLPHGVLFGAESRLANSPILLLLVSVASVMLALVVLWSNGSMMATGAFVAVSLIVLTTLYRIDLGFLVLMAMTLVFGQFEVPGFNTLTFRVSYFRNIKEISYIPYLSIGDANPFEVHLLFIIAVWVVLVGLRRGARPRPVTLWIPACIWFSWLIGSFIYGMSHGGDFLPALWETRALMYMGAVFMLVPQVIRTKEQITAFFWVAICGITFKAFEGILRYQGNGWSMLGYEAMQAHEDPLLISTLFFLLLGLAIFGGHRRQRGVLVILLVPLLLGFYVGNRRAAYAAFLISFIAYLVLIPWKDLLRALKYIGPVVLFLSLYTLVFWNSDGKFAGPIQQIKSGFDKDESEGGELIKDRNYYSNLYRRIEDYDLAVTIQNSPIAGIGFGTKYEQPIDLVPLDFALRDYMAHNNVLWLLAKVGAVGFFIFWFFMNSLAFRGVSLLGQLEDPYLKTICALSVVSIVTLIAAAYFDLHLVRYRTMIYFGALLGLIASIQNIEKERAGKVKPGTASSSFQP